MADITITISAVDKTSPVLVKISGAAKKAGSDLESAGRKGKKGLEDMETGAKKADQQLRTFERTSLAVGATVGALALGLVRVSSAYMQQERQLAAVTRLYGEAGDEILRYAEAIQDTTRFSNDAARQSAIVLNTLTANYGLAQTQIETLMARSADLAALHGKSLEEISQMVSNAMRGEGEYIEQIGVTMNQTFIAAEAAARGMKNFISEMTAAEQAAFRYTVFLEQTAAAQGYAAETATGARGAFGLLFNEVQDGAQAFGSMLGPVADVAAQFNAYALWLPLIASQTARVSAIMINSARSGQAMAAAGSLLRFAFNPLTLIFGAIVVAAGAMGLKMLENRQQMAQAAAAAEQTANSYRALRDVIAQLYLSGDNDAADWANKQQKSVQSFIDGWQKAVDDGLAAEDDGNWFTNFSDAFTANFGKAMQSLVPNDSAFDRVGEALEGAGEGFNRAALEALQITPQTEQAINASLTRLFSLLSNPNVDVAAFERGFSLFFEQTISKVLAGDLPTDQIDEEFDKFYDTIVRQAQRSEQVFEDLELQFQLDDLRIEGLDNIADDVETFTDLMDRITNVQSQFSQWTPGLGAGQPLRDLSFTADQLGVLERSFDRIGEAINSGDFDNPAINSMIDDLLRLFQLGKIDAATFTAAIVSAATNMGQFALDAESAAFKAKTFEDAIQSLGSTATESAEELRTAFGENMAEFIGSYLDAFEMNDPLSLINFSSLRNEFTALAEDVGNAAAQLDTVFRVIVGNTNQIAQSAQSVNDWATGMFEVVDGASQMGDLLNNNWISQTQYNEALAAQGQIAESNLHIQRDTLTIQAMQMPFIAQHTAMLEDQMHALSNQSTEQQRITLGWMDTATAAQAYTLIQQAAAVGAGELGSAGEEAFHAMIEGAIAVNPFLFDMLETIGLISGTPLDFEVNFDGVTEGMTEIEMLTLRIEDLIRALDGDLTPIDIEVNGLEKIEQANTSIEEIFANTAKDIAIKFSVQGDDGTGGAGNALDFLTGAYEPLPIDVPVSFNVSESGNGDGTGGATNALDFITGNATVDPVTVPVNFEYGDTEAGGGIQDFLDTYGGEEGVTIKVGIETDTSAIDEAIGSISGTEISGPMFVFQTDTTAIDVTASVYGATQVDGPTFVFQADESVVSSAQNIRAGFNPQGPTFTFLTDTATIDGSIGHYAGLNIHAPTFTFVADTSAMDGAIGAYTGQVGTATIKVNYDTSGLYPFGVRHGGVPAFASGGLVELAEAGPELLHFAGGGTAAVQDRGIYTVPNNTYVSPANANRGDSGTVIAPIFNNYAPIYGVDDLDQKLAEFAVIIRDDLDRHQRAAGVRR